MTLASIQDGEFKAACYRDLTLLSFHISLSSVKYLFIFLPDFTVSVGLFGSETSLYI